MKVGERVVLRKRAGLTQRQLAKRIGIDTSRVSLWENGEIELPIGEVEKIAAVLAVEINRVPAPSTATEIVHVLSPMACAGAER